MSNPPTSDRKWKLKPCAQCGTSDWMYGHRKLCSSCRAAKALAPENIQKEMARQIMATAIGAGILIRQPCVECVRTGREQKGVSHGHHEDYAKPLEVKWLCVMHHRWAHPKKRASDLLEAAE